MVVPCICAGLLYLQRHEVFRAAASRFGLGIPLILVLAAAAWLLWRRFPSNQNDPRLSIGILEVLFVWAAGFVLCYGLEACGSRVSRCCFWC